MIAEDTEAVRTILDQQLKKLGIEADFVENGQLAIDALKSKEYGILFTDLHMPELDGYGVIKHIRDGEVDTDIRFPVIVLTADVQMAQRQTYMDLGFDECLLKPVSLAQVRRLMMRWGLLPESLPDGTTDTTEAPLQTDTLAKGTPINIVELENMLGELDDMAVEMMGMFADMTEPLIADLIKAHDAQDWHQFEEIGHSLKGSSRSACAVTLGDICADIQDEAPSASDKRRKELLDMAVTEFENVKSHIQDIQKNGF